MIPERMMSSRKDDSASCLGHRDVLFPFHLAAKERVQSGLGLLIFFLGNLSVQLVGFQLEQLVF
jgi:hypothetical protein